MASLPTKSFATIVADTIAGMQGRSAALIDFSIGSPLRAIAEGFAGLFLWFQSLVLQVLNASRLSTATGIDVDTFTADFMPAVAGTTSPRLGRQAASGQVTFSRFTAAAVTCFIPVGATVQTTDGSQTFSVTANATFPTYSAALAGYTLPSSVASIVVPVQDLVAGQAGNIAAGAISVMTSPITGIDNVTNVAAFTNGADQESDNALKKRFSDYIMGLSRGDLFGTAASLESVDVTMQFAVTEDWNYDGSYRPGYYFIVCDDGSGSPSNDFMTAMLSAANAVRPLGVQCAVFPPVTIEVDVGLQIITLPGFDHNLVEAQVSAFVSTSINSLGLGNPLPWSIIAAWAYSIPGVSSVQAVTIDGVDGDAASVYPYRLSQDNTATIITSTIKVGSLEIS